MIQQARDSFLKKMEAGEYEQITRNCLVCNSNNFETIAERDRHDVPMSTQICKDCGFVQTNPVLTEQSLDRFYNSEYRVMNDDSPEPDENFFKKQLRTGETIHRFVKNQTGLDLGKGHLVVEIGAASGGTIARFQSKGCDVFGVDLTASYVEYGKKKGIPMATGTIENIIKLGKIPDLIIYNNAFEHIYDPVKELQKIRSVMNEKTLVFIDVPSILDIPTSYHTLKNYLTIAHISHFSRQSFLNMVRKEGFQEVFSDQSIVSLIKKGPKENKIVPCYEETMDYLKKLEKTKVQNSAAKKKLFGIVRKISEKTGTKQFLKSVYYKNDEWQMTTDKDLEN